MCVWFELALGVQLAARLCAQFTKAKLPLCPHTVVMCCSRLQDR